jgi:hypothetical protein
VQSASFCVAGDELVAPRSDEIRGADGLASPREIRDRRGNLWTLREKHLTRAWTAHHLAPSTLARAAHGWLLFENGMRRIIVTPPPARWQEMDDHALIRLMQRHASHRRTRRRTATASGG